MHRWREISVRLLLSHGLDGAFSACAVMLHVNHMVQDRMGMQVLPHIAVCDSFLHNASNRLQDV